MRVKAPTQDEMVSGGNRLTEPGKYHAVVLNVLVGAMANGNPGGCDTLELEILAGVDGNGQKIDCYGKTIAVTFWEPDPGKTEKEQLQTEKLNTAMLIATQLLTPKQLGTETEVDTAAAIGRHVNIHFERKMKKNEANELVPDKDYLRIVWQDIFHIDDPDAKAYPKNADALKYIEPQFRIANPDEYFAYKVKRAAAAKAAGGTAHQAAAKKPSPAMNF